MERLYYILAIIVCWSFPSVPRFLFVDGGLLIGVINFLIFFVYLPAFINKRVGTQEKEKKTTALALVKSRVEFTTRDRRMSSLVQKGNKYSDDENWALLFAYRRNPADLSCPRGCSKGSVEVLGFIGHTVDGGWVDPSTPDQRDYAVCLYCHQCKGSGGLVMSQ
jgi:hypothetical protein